MRRYHIWYVVAVFWGLDAIVGALRVHRGQAALAGVFACCFLVVGLFFQHREEVKLRREYRTRR